MNRGLGAAVGKPKASEAWAPAVQATKCGPVGRRAFSRPLLQEQCTGPPPLASWGAVHKQRDGESKHSVSRFSFPYFSAYFLQLPTPSQTSPPTFGAPIPSTGIPNAIHSFYPPPRFSIIMLWSITAVHLSSPHFNAESI